MADHTPTSADTELSQTHYRYPEYVVSPVNATFLGWLFLLGVPLLMLFLIYAREQSNTLHDVSAPMAHAVEILPGADTGSDAGVTMGEGQ